MKYPTVRKIMQLYKKFGFINKPLNTHEKAHLLKSRTQRKVQSKGRKPLNPLRIACQLQDNVLNLNIDKMLVSLAKPDDKDIADESAKVNWRTFSNIE